MKSVFFDDDHKWDKSYRNIQHSLCHKWWMTNMRTCSVPIVPSWNNANTKKKKLVDKINAWMQLVTVMPSNSERMDGMLWFPRTVIGRQLSCNEVYSFPHSFHYCRFSVLFVLGVFLCALLLLFVQSSSTHLLHIHSITKKLYLLLLLSLVLFIFCPFCFLYNQMPHLPLIQCPLLISNYTKSLVYLSTFQWLGMPRGVPDTPHLMTPLCSFWQ